MTNGSLHLPDVLSGLVNWSAHTVVCGEEIPVMPPIDSFVSRDAYIVATNVVTAVRVALRKLSPGITPNFHITKRGMVIRGHGTPRLSGGLDVCCPVYRSLLPWSLLYMNPNDFARHVEQFTWTQKEDTPDEAADV